MIRDASVEYLAAKRDDLVSKITGELVNVCGEKFVVKNADIGPLARVIDHYLSSAGIRDVDDNSRLIMMVAKVLGSIGRDGEARKLFILGSGMLKPAEWEISRGESMWILDLKTMTLKVDSSLEILFFCSLNVVMDSIADLWDESCGFGVLGLKNVYSAASAMMGSPSDERTSAFLGEIKGLCDSKFRQFAEERKWQSVPDVLNLD